MSTAVLNRNYDKYKDTNLTFNTNVTNKSGLRRKEVILKCKSLNSRCILYSASMQQARIIAQVDKEWMNCLNDSNKNVTLLLAFKNSMDTSTVSFFISCKVEDFSPYQGSNHENFYFITVSFRKKAPDILIERISEILDQKFAKEKRSNGRIQITSAIRKKMGMDSFENYLFRDGNGKRCVLTELSLFSAQVFLTGTEDEFQDKRVLLVFKIKQLPEMGEMVGTVVRSEKFGLKSEIVSLVIDFDQELIPPSYKMFVGKYLEVIMK